jgi:tryptophan 2,3-dioxygenase
LTCPVHGGGAPDDNAPKRDVDYGSYLRVEELLTLQTPLSVPEHPDELLFIVVHQASELWFKVLLHEFDTFIGRLETADVAGGLQSIKRINGLVGIISNQLSALDTLPPQRFAQFRGYLGSSSGSQSYQFRAIEAVSGLRDSHFLHIIAEHGPVPELVQKALERPTLQALFTSLLEKHGVTIEQVYTDAANTSLLLLAEELLEYEQGATCRANHRRGDRRDRRHARREVSQQDDLAAFFPGAVGGALEVLLGRRPQGVAGFESDCLTSRREAREHVVDSVHDHRDDECAGESHKRVKEDRHQKDCDGTLQPLHGVRRREREHRDDVGRPGAADHRLEQPKEHTAIGDFFAHTGGDRDENEQCDVARRPRGELVHEHRATLVISAPAAAQ